MPESVVESYEITSKTDFPRHELVDREFDVNEQLKEYRSTLFSADEIYRSLPFKARVVATLPSTAIAILANLCFFAVWAVLLPSGVHLVDLLFTPAYAADGGGIDIRVAINGLIFAVLFITFLTSLWVTYFGNNMGANELASTVTKTLLGFFVGAATSFLQIAPPH